MALDATVGGTTSNSYVTLEEANRYFEDRAHNTKWNDATEREELLITASQTLDWYMKWRGTKTASDQSMDWPRTDVIGDDGTEYEVDTIPPEVKIATYEMALSSIDKDRTADQDMDGINEVRAGSLLLRTDSTLRAKQFQTVPDKIRRILRDVITNAGIGVVRLIRA